MEFAVNMPEQEPQVGQAFFSSSSSPFWSSCPTFILPIPSKIEMRSQAVPSESFPASIGPPDAKMVGMLTRIAPMSIPGTTLSQFGMQIMASNGCAVAMDSTQSAMSSRLGRENFIP